MMYAVSPAVAVTDRNIIIFCALRSTAAVQGDSRTALRSSAAVFIQKTLIINCSGTANSSIFGRMEPCVMSIS